MKIPVKITVIVDVPDEFVAEHTKHTNGTTPAELKKAAEPPKPKPALAPGIRKFADENTPPRLGVPATLEERFGGISITATRKMVLKKALDQGKITTVKKGPFSYTNMSQMHKAGLLSMTQELMIGPAGNRLFKNYYELTELGLEALAWYEEKYEKKH